MKFEGFVGGSYQSRSLTADNQRCVNLYPEAIESGSGKSRVVLYRTPGLLNFCTLPDWPVRRIYELNDKVFAVAGQTFFELFSGGTYAIRGLLSPIGPCSIDGNGIQIIIASGGLLYCYNVSTLTLTPIVAPPALWVVHSDLYFIAQEPNSQKIWISGLLDGLTWDPLDFASAEAVPDNLVQIIADHRELWLFGTRSIQPYYNSGAPDFPFEPISGALIETGSIGLTVAKCDNTLFWVSQDARGAAMVWRAEGFRPVRVSTHAVEHSLGQCTDLDLATAWSYQEEGHIFYMLRVPSLPMTWVYDAATNLWHERAWWNGKVGTYEAHRSSCHAYAWGKHLVGDRMTGNIYEQSVAYWSDNGDLIRWMRMSPHLSNEDKWIYYHSLELAMETGHPIEGQAMLRWSNNEGRTWSNLLTASIGAIGEFGTRVIWRRLGKGRNRVFEVTGTDAIPIAITDAFLEISPGAH